MARERESGCERAKERERKNASRASPSGDEERRIKAAGRRVRGWDDGKCDGRWRRGRGEGVESGRWG